MKFLSLVLQLVIISITLLSCQNGNKQNGNEKTETMQEKCEAARRKAYLSPHVVDTIFLDLAFGMSKKEVTSHLNKMVKQKKLSKNNSGEYTYTLTAAGETVKAELYTEFFNDKLYQVVLSFKEKLIGGSYIPMDGRLLITTAKAAFYAKINASKEKYQSFQYKIGNIGWFLCFVKDNLIVDFLPEGLMSYADAPIIREKELLEKKQKAEKEKQTISDL